MSIDEKAFSKLLNETLDFTKFSIREVVEQYENKKEQPDERTAFERWWRNQFAFTFPGNLDAPDTTFYGAKKEHVKYIWQEGRKSFAPKRNKTESTQP